ncbi:hypothetical protein Tco_1078253 [Tanacetum coccineum]
MASQDARLSKFESNFKQQQSEMTNKIITVLKAITDQIAGTLPSDTVKNPKLSTTPVLSARSYTTIDPQCSSQPSNSINAIKAHFKEEVNRHEVLGYIDITMSDSEDSTVTYMQVSSPFEDSSDVGSPGVDGPPVMPEDPYAYIAAAYQAPPSPDYMPSPEETQSPPSLDFIPEPMYPEYMPLEDEILPAKEQPLPAAASPTADSPGYVPESDLEEEPEADDDEDPEEDPTDYPADRDDDDEEEEEPSGDDTDDKDEDDDEDEEEEEEHPAPADSVPPVHRMTARISIRDEPSISLPPREEVERLLALTTPPPSPLTPLSSPLPHIPSPPLPALPLASVLPALPLPTSSPPLQLLSSDRRADRPEITLPPQKRLGIDLGPRCKVGESSAAAVVRPIGGHRADYRNAAEEVALTTLEGVNTRVTELAAVQEQDTQDIYDMIEDTQGRQTQIYHRVETLVDDSQYHYETARLLDQEALVSREAWGCSMEVSYMARSEIMALRSIVMSQQTVILQLQAADLRSQTVTSEMLQADHMRQAEIAALRTFDRNTDAGGDAGSGGDGICGNGDDSGVSGDGGGVVKARSRSTSSLGGSDIDGSSRIDILEVYQLTLGSFSVYLCAINLLYTF